MLTSTFVSVLIILGRTFVILVLALRKTSSVRTSTFVIKSNISVGVLSTMFTLSMKIMKSPVSRWHKSAGEFFTIWLMTQGFVHTMFSSNPNFSLERKWNWKFRRTSGAIFHFFTFCLPFSIVWWRWKLTVPSFPTSYNSRILSFSAPLVILVQGIEANKTLREFLSRRMIRWLKHMPFLHCKRN